jgi:hypothetical protein
MWHRVLPGLSPMQQTEPVARGLLSGNLGPVNSFL